MVFYGDLSGPAGDDEFIYITKDQKHEDEEMQMLTPILLDSMFDLKSAPTSVFRTSKNLDKADDATEATADSLSEIFVPDSDVTPNSPPVIMTTMSYYEDDASEISEDEGSYYRGEQLSLSSQQVISTRTATSYPFEIPADIRYDGQVMFAVSRSTRNIHLQPRESALAQAIFAHKDYDDFEYFGEVALADSISSCENGNGAEECKYDEDEPEPTYDEGFAYVYGNQYKEDVYWFGYNGHYGSREFDTEHAPSADYALDHASVQGSFDVGTQKAFRKNASGAPSHERSFLDAVQDAYSFFFSCTSAASVL